MTTSRPTKIAILGSSGMLGSTVSRYFGGLESYTTLQSFRSEEFNFGKNCFYFDALDSRSLDALPEVDYVINCVGCVKQQDHDVRTYMKVNAQFPHFLAAACERTQSKLIHITTDCVFSGRRGDYHELDEPDCEDSYGISKELGEPRNCMVLRTSIIGPELRSFYSLFEWARSQRGKRVEGYTNHIWNGVTALQYAKICDQIISGDMWKPGLRHIFGESLSKHDMLQQFNKTYDLDLTIVPTEQAGAVIRTLSTVYSLNDQLNTPSFQDMIEAMRFFELS